ncbi:phytoene desaturase family protein [Allobranchiibius huperziae]|uniref:Pyridine nucleotide-disulfide oxidoreductase domain-containing protein 2 n=1 Tax=Allobranchiibius huperziae TaxID=1874116 RepID=A0A853DBX8_9MICO|nr:NAD(P)/FAD-dependent oxidoreductase [Allobranchiibius huperziae]NYJ73453.1 phytoene dehydrogenase-like protein [Allobranchiibius huperziae]
MAGERDAVVVGAGPNGLAAAVTLARAGLRVDLLEQAGRIGGGAGTRELTLPGFHHDVASAVHPMALASPFFRQFQIERRIDLRVPEISFGHPLPHGRSGIAYRDLDRTAEALGRDGAAYRRLFAPLVRRVEQLTRFTGESLLQLPTEPAVTLDYGLRALEQGSPAWRLRFHEEVAPAILTGAAAHTIGSHPRLAMAGAGLALGTHAHAAGWPVPIGGSQAIADALAADFEAHGGRIVTGTRVRDLSELTDYDTVVLDVSTRLLASIGRDRLPARYLGALRRFRHGNGVAKMDLALDGPVPWTDTELRRTPTIHLGGTRQQIAASERDVAKGRLPDRPYVLLVQPSVIDPTRAPEGKATLWAYTHVPYDCPVDRTEAMLDMVQEHAPGIRDLILARSATPASRFADVSPNFAGGDFATGAVTMAQLIKRPVVSRTPWRTPIDGLYLGSSATSPGPSVHGLSGWYAARTALRDRYGLGAPELGIE